MKYANSLTNSFLVANPENGIKLSFVFYFQAEFTPAEDEEDTTCEKQQEW